MAINFSPFEIIVNSETGDNEPKGGDCNCDCACPIPTESLLLSSDAVFQSPWAAELEIPKDLYLAPLTEGYYLAFNPLADHGQVIVLNREAYNLLQLFQYNSHVDSVVSLVEEWGVEQQTVILAISEFHRLSILISDDWQPVEPGMSTDVLVAWVHITNQCNLRCTYCYLHKTNDDMQPDVGVKALDAIFRSAQAHGYKKVKIKFAGGEATLNFKLVTQLYDYGEVLASSLGIKFDAVVLSNGVGITEHMVRALSVRNIRLMISLDGITKYNDAQRVFANGKGSFAIVAKTINRLLSWGLTPDISITITDKNIDGLADLLEFVLIRKLPFSLNFYRDNECSTEIEELRFSDERMISGMAAAYTIIEELLPEQSLLGAIADRANFTRPHSKTCGVGDNYIVIDEHGNISKCQMTIKDTIGTVDEPDVIALIRQDQIGIRNLPVQEKEGCKDCTWRFWCTGGCSLYTYRVTGRYDIKSPNCRIYKAIYPHILRLEALRILRIEQRDVKLS